MAPREAPRGAWKRPGSKSRSRSRAGAGAGERGGDHRAAGGGAGPPPPSTVAGPGVGGAVAAWSWWATTARLGSEAEKRRGARGPGDPCQGAPGGVASPPPPSPPPPSPPRWLEADAALPAVALRIPDAMFSRINASCSGAREGPVGAAAAATAPDVAEAEAGADAVGSDGRAGGLAANTSRWLDAVSSWSMPKSSRSSRSSPRGRKSRGADSDGVAPPHFTRSLDASTS